MKYKMPEEPSKLSSRPEDVPEYKTSNSPSSHPAEESKPLLKKKDDSSSDNYRLTPSEIESLRTHGKLISGLTARQIQSSIPESEVTPCPSDKTMLKKIISGCQTGADIAGVDAAITCNFPYGGWVPKGRRTADGPLDGKYHVKEMPTIGYPKRTEQNVIDSDGTVIFVHGKLSGGSDLTRKLAVKHERPWLHLDMLKYSKDDAVIALLAWIEINRIEVLNVAGRSATKDGQIYDVVYDVILHMLRKITSANS